MVKYRGAHNARVMGYQNRIAAEHGELITWRQYVSANDGSISAYLAGGGTTRYYREQAITGLIAAPQMGESRFRQQQLPAGQVVAGDAVLSCPYPIGVQDEIIWRGTIYRAEGDNVPITFGGHAWYRAILRRADATG